MTNTHASNIDSYVPGVCNINHMEVARRWRIGYIGTALLIVALPILFGFSTNRYARLVVFLPAFMAASGFLQARNKFCTGYGSRGQQNAAEGSTGASRVTDEAALRRDRQRARQINLQATGIALVVTVLVLLVG